MAKGSIRRYDTQAKISLYAAVAGILGLGGLGYLLLRNLNWETRLIVYSNKGLYMPVILLLTAGTLLLAGTATAMGANSAGQRRNERSRLSWMAFFLGAVTIALTIILFFGFYKSKVGV